MFEDERIESILVASNGCANTLCPKCGTSKVRQCVRRGVLEYLISLVGVYPHDCTYYTCQHRFYRRSLQTSGNSLDRSILENLYDRVKKETLPQPKQLVSDMENPDPFTDESLAQTILNSKKSIVPSIDSDSQGYNFLPLPELYPCQTLTLTWNDNGQQKNQTIYSQNQTGLARRVKLGRNPAQCDIIFGDRTVSGVNAEIYFDFQLQTFFLTNLRAINPPFIDKNKVISTTVLTSGTTLFLGRIPVAIEIKNDYTEIEPTLGFDTPTHLFDRDEFTS